VDAVVVATPPASHFQIARDCLQHNRHVLVEKPLTLNSQHAEELIETAKARGLTLMVGHTFEYNPAVRALKEIIQSGDLGRVYYVDAVRVNLGLFQPDLDVLWDLAPHDLSILRYILGRDPISIRAQGAANIFKDKYDVVYLSLWFPDDILAHVHVSWLDPRKVRRFTVVGSQKMVVYDDVETLEKIRIYDKGVEAPPYTDTFGDFQCSYRYGDVVIPNIHLVEPLRLECQHFLDCIADCTQPQSSGRVGLEVVKTLEKAEKSLQNGGAQEKIFVEDGNVHERLVA
jgi:predicted dehydrogenase